MPRSSLAEKLCRDCGVPLTAENQYPSHIGVAKLCRRCSSARSAEYYRQNAERQTAAARRRYHRDPIAAVARVKRSLRRLRLEAIAEYGSRCVHCGDPRAEVLTFDHVHNDGAAHRRELRDQRFAGNSFVRWLKTQGWPKDRFQLLCWNCNMAKQHYGRLPDPRPDMVPV